MPEIPGTLDSGAGKPWDTNFGAGKALGHQLWCWKNPGTQFWCRKNPGTQFWCRKNPGTPGGRTTGIEPLPTQPSVHSTTRLPGYAQDCSPGNLGISGSKMHPQSVQIRLFCMMGLIFGYMVSVSEWFAQVCSIILHLFCKG